MGLDVLLGFAFVFDGICDFFYYLLLLFGVKDALGGLVFVLVHFGLGKGKFTMRSLRASFYFLSLSMVDFCFLMTLTLSSM